MASFLWYAASIFNSINKDYIPTVDELNKNLKAFNVSAHASLYQPIFDVINVFWSQTWSQLSQNDWCDLAYDSAQILANAAQKLASKYIPAQ